MGAQGLALAGPAMDLANMRQNGVRSLTVSCLNCRHSADIDVRAFRVTSKSPLLLPAFAEPSAAPTKLTRGQLAASSPFRSDRQVAANSGNRRLSCKA